MSNSRFRIWEDIATILRAEIASGQWQPDAVLPPQKELARRFGVQTQTIGKALQQLTAEGLLYAPHGLRERRVTTARAKSHRAGDFLHDPAWTNPRLETAYLKVEVPPDAIHALMPNAASLLHWITKQWDGPELVALSDAWYYPAPWLMDYALKPTGDNFYEELEQQHHTEIKGFQETVQARVATNEERALFKEPGRAPLPVLVIQRQAISVDGRVLEIATLTDRASRYILDYWVPHPGFKE